MSEKKVLRVLVADDNEVNQAVVRGMLEYAGHQVDTVLDGQAAIKALKKASYDLVIMDCLMPVMDGFAATCSIRAATLAAFDSNIPILAMTALVTPEDKRRCFEAGMSGYIGKPVMARNLFAWIGEHLGTHIPSSGGGRRSPGQPGKTLAAPGDAMQTTCQADLIREMSGILERDASQWQAESRALFDAGRIEQLGALAHKIRGTADVLGYKELSTIAAKLEKSGTNGAAGEVAKLVNQLVKALIRLIDEIRKGS